MKFAGNFTSLPSRLDSSLPHGNDPFLFAVLSKGINTFISVSSTPSPNLIVQLPAGDGCNVFQPIKLREPGVVIKWTEPLLVPPHGYSAKWL